MPAYRVCARSYKELIMDRLHENLSLEEFSDYTGSRTLLLRQIAQFIAGAAPTCIRFPQYTPPK